MMANLKEVAQEEMLHFALAGNILCAFGGTPKLYGEKYTPKYPIQIFNDNVQLNLRGTTKEDLQTFVSVATSSFVGIFFSPV